MNYYAVHEYYMTWALIVVPSGLSLRGPDMLLDMCLLAAFGETAGSDGSGPVAVALSELFGWSGATDPAKAATYVTPPLGDTSCQLRDAVCSPTIADALLGRGADPAPSAGRLLLGSEKSPGLVSSLALHLPTSWLGCRLWSHPWTWCHGSHQTSPASSSDETSPSSAPWEVPGKAEGWKQP